MRNLQAAAAKGLMATAMAEGNVNLVSELLRRKNLDLPINEAFRKMQIIQRNVRGSEAEKDSLLPKLFALRLWSGCSALFFTLNPHDIRSSITMALLHGDMRLERQFSLDMPDADTEAYFVDSLKDQPRRLH